MSDVRHLGERTMHHAPRRHARRSAAWLALAVGLGALAAWMPASGGIPENYIRNNKLVANPEGRARTFSKLGDILFSNPFFLDLGTNGRSCATCHVPPNGWALVPEEVQARFEATSGHDPLFRTVDGSTSPLADVSTLDARRRAYRLLLSRAVIRIGLPVPAGAEFKLQAVDDPYGYASAQELSLFRRPLPATNLRFLSTVMWDGRESRPGVSLHDNLARQAGSATLGHAEATRALTPAQQDEIVELTTVLFTAQAQMSDTGNLGNAAKALSLQKFSAGTNSAPFDPEVFTLFGKWRRDERRPARQAIGRGEEIFNHRQFGAGLTCSTCHNAPNAGSNSTGAFFNTGVSRAARRSPTFPLYTLRCTSTGARVRTTDPGRALVTGRCADIGSFKVPVLRGLATRAPYFHDGSAPSVEAVLDFYEQRFGLGLAPGERYDLLRFLNAL